MCQVVWQDLTFTGALNSPEKELHTNIKAIQLPLNAFLSWIMRGKTLVLLSSNATVVTYVKKQNKSISGSWFIFLFVFFFSLGERLHNTLTQEIYRSR